MMLVASVLRLVVKREREAGEGVEGTIIHSMERSLEALQFFSLKLDGT